MVQLIFKPWIKSGPFANTWKRPYGHREWKMFRPNDRIWTSDTLTLNIWSEAQQESAAEARVTRDSSACIKTPDK